MYDVCELLVTCYINITLCNTFLPTVRYYDVEENVISKITCQIWREKDTFDVDVDEKNCDLGVSRGVKCCSMEEYVKRY